MYRLWYYHNYTLMKAFYDQAFTPTFSVYESGVFVKNVTVNLVHTITSPSTGYHNHISTNMRYLIANQSIAWKSGNNGAFIVHSAIVNSSYTFCNLTTDYTVIILINPFIAD